MNLEHNMRLALELAQKSADNGEVPIGAIIVRNNEILSSAHNRTIIDADPTAHAEVIAIREAAKKINNYRISDSAIFVTLEPCIMCYGAIIQSRISRVFFGAYDSKFGACASCSNLKDNKLINHKPQIIGGILQSECSSIIKDFFKTKRN